MTFFIFDWAKRDSNIYTCKHNNIFHTKFANKIDQNIYSNYRSTDCQQVSK